MNGSERKWTSIRAHIPKWFQWGQRREGRVRNHLGLKLTVVLIIDFHPDYGWNNYGALIQEVRLFGSLLKLRCLLGLRWTGLGDKHILFSKCQKRGQAGGREWMIIGRKYMVSEMRGWKGLGLSLEEHLHLVFRWREQRDRPVMGRKPGESVV